MVLLKYSDILQLINLDDLNIDNDQKIILILKIYLHLKKMTLLFFILKNIKILQKILKPLFV